MNYTILKKLPPLEKILQEFPLSEEIRQKIERDRQEIKNILEGKDNRLLIIVGPCSAWPKEAVLEYARRLKALDEQVDHALKIVMRVYIQKPRTTKGWAGPLSQPDITSKPDLEAGLRYTREMMIKVLNIGLPIADEALFTHQAKGFLELLSWVAIGARSAEDQTHRIFASALDCAVGMKNPTHGSVSLGMNGVISAQHAHTALIDGYEVQTSGNRHAHLVLRGSHHTSNYSVAHLEEAERLMNKHHITHPALLIDVSHDNCFFQGKKDPRRQPSLVLEVLNSLVARPDLKKLVKGFMIESFIKEGHQCVDEQHPEKIDRSGLSLTDPCLGWESTQELLFTLADIPYEP